MLLLPALLPLPPLVQANPGLTRRPAAPRGGTVGWRPQQAARGGAGQETRQTDGQSRERGRQAAEARAGQGTRPTGGQDRACRMRFHTTRHQDRVDALLGKRQKCMPPHENTDTRRNRSRCVSPATARNRAPPPLGSQRASDWAGWSACGDRGREQDKASVCVASQQD